jgi:tRNA (guanine-N7-)-methyltransferase
VSAADGPSGSDVPPRFHGRRRGRRLRAGRGALLTTLLPRLRIVLPPEGSTFDPRALFGNTVGDIWLEVGFGAGEHLAAQAAAHPDVGFIGCEPYVNGVASLLAQVKERELANVRVFDDDARPLLAALPEASIGRVFVLFSDPWPKKRHNDRRFIGPATRTVLARVLNDGGELCFASDQMEYVRWTLEHLTAEPSFAWSAREAADWRHRPADWFETRYEAKALTRGAPCSYLRFRRRPRRETAKNPCAIGGSDYIRG